MEICARPAFENAGLYRRGHAENGHSLFEAAVPIVAWVVLTL